jgi:hypothetical protein
MEGMWKFNLNLKGLITIFLMEDNPHKEKGHLWKGFKDLKKRSYMIELKRVYPPFLRRDKKIFCSIFI